MGLNSNAYKLEDPFGRGGGRASPPAPLVWKMYGAAGTMYMLARGKRKANLNTALYTPDMNSGRGTGPGGDRGGTDGDEESQGAA